MSLQSRLPIACWLRFALGAALPLTLSAQASAQSAPPHRHDWAWPIYEATSPTKLTADDLIETALARPSMWTSNGEYQNFGAARFQGVDPHPGIDIRAKAGDVAVFPASGQLFGVQNVSQCEDASTGDKCRLFVRTDDGLVYYFAHFSIGGAPDGAMVRNYREALNNAAAGTGSTRVTKQQQAGVTRAYRSPPNWDHLHLTIFDPAQTYDSLDPLEFLDRHTVSMTGAVLDIVDDERPQVGAIDFVADGGSVNTAGFCGIELKGAVDIDADLRDTFFTSRPQPNPFPGRDTLHDTIGVKGARYLVRPIASATSTSSGTWYQSPLGCAGTACGNWRLRFPSADRGAGLIASNNDALFLTYLNADAPVAMAGEPGPSLWDVSRTTQDHVISGTTPFSFIYILTNGVNENSGAVNGSWNTASAEDGRYVVTVEAWDADGNLGQRSLPVTVNNTGGASAGTGPSWGQIYVKDSDADFGQIPSTLGGEVFWASPDIIVVPKGQSVAEDAFASSFPLVVGEEYAVYVRAHNHGCTAVSGVQASVYTATPGTTLGNVRPVSPAGWAGDAVVVPPGGSKLIGPFLWKVTAADLDGGSTGHRCFLAAVHAPTDASPAQPDPALWNVVNEDNVAQRNIQTEELAFAIRNVNPAQGQSKLVIELTDWPSTDATFQLLVPQASQLSGAWTYPVESGKYVLNVATARLETPVWTMPGVSQLDAEVRFTLPDGVKNRKVTVTHQLDGNVVGGMVFFLSGQDVVK
ncbi:MAG: hypothetical protein ABJB12_11795 [Pseudomonadota bacterium]